MLCGITSKDKIHFLLLLFIVIFIVIFYKMSNYVYLFINILFINISYLERSFYKARKIVFIRQIKYKRTSILVSTLYHLSLYQQGELKLYCLIKFQSYRVRLERC